MSKATESKLGDLHGKVAHVMDNALRQVERAQELYDATPDEVITENGLSPVEVNPALLSVITRFLDSNKITCAAEDDDTTSELGKRLEERRAKRAGRRTVGNVSYLDTGTD